MKDNNLIRYGKSDPIYFQTQGYLTKFKISYDFLKTEKNTENEPEIVYDEGDFIVWYRWFPTKEETQCKGFHIITEVNMGFNYFEGTKQFLTVGISEARFTND